MLMMAVVTLESSGGGVHGEAEKTIGMVLVL